MMLNAIKKMLKAIKKAIINSHRKKLICVDKELLIQLFAFFAHSTLKTTFLNDYYIN